MTVENDAAFKDLYERWEKEFWSASEIDLSQDKRDWLALNDEERRHWYWLAGFSTYLVIEPDAVRYFSSLVPMLRTARQQTALGLQIADEGRHAFFFQRYYDEVISAALPVFETHQIASSAPYRYLVFDGPSAAIEDAVAQRTDAAMAGAIVHAFIILEGTLGLANFSNVRLLLSRTKLFPGLLAGMTKAHQDEYRHAQLGVALLHDLIARDPSVRNAIVLKLNEILPALSDVLRPQPARSALLTSLGLNPMERRERAFAHLNRSLNVLGIDSDLTTRWASLDAPRYATKIPMPLSETSA